VLVSCPTCGRTEVDVIKLAEQSKQSWLKSRSLLKWPSWVASSTPGEAKDADVGIAGGKGRGILFKKGKKVGVVEERDFVRVLMAEIGKL